jgi:hypothetical protein
MRYHSLSRALGPIVLPAAFVLSRNISWAYTPSKFQLLAIAIAWTSLAAFLWMKTGFRWRNFNDQHIQLTHLPYILGGMLSATAFISKIAGSHSSTQSALAILPSIVFFLDQRSSGITLDYSLAASEKPTAQGTKSIWQLLIVIAVIGQMALYHNYARIESILLAIVCIVVFAQALLNLHQLLDSTQTEHAQVSAQDERSRGPWTCLPRSIATRFAMRDMATVMAVLSMLQAAFCELDHFRQLTHLPSLSLRLTWASLDWRQQLYFGELFSIAVGAVVQLLFAMCLLTTVSCHPPATFPPLD